MHDNYNGRINHIAMSFDKKYLFTVGNDGNIFSYKWREQFEAPASAHPTPIQLPIEPVVDIDDPEMLSLEDQKQKNNADIRLRIANERKDGVLHILSDYELQFRDILRRNKELPSRQQVEQHETELDNRITEIVQNNFNAQMNIVKRKLAFDVEKCKLLSKKVAEYFIEPLDTFPIQLLSIRLVIYFWIFSIYLYCFVSKIDLNLQNFRQTTNISYQQTVGYIFTFAKHCRGNDQD